jgi:hypothetical protein
MQRKNIIVDITPCTLTPIVRGNFKKLCEDLELPYHSLKMLKFPFSHKDYVIHKVEFK